MPLSKIVSGGQTGADRAALDAGLAAGLAVGGWCPRGRGAEDGVIPSRYPLEETPREALIQRTEWNVRDSDGTLILNLGELEGGTLKTIEFAVSHGKPFTVVALDGAPAPAEVVDWIAAEGIETLNIAGPRESKRPGIHDRARRFLDRVLAEAGRA